MTIFSQQPLNLTGGDTSQRARVHAGRHRRRTPLAHLAATVDSTIHADAPIDTRLSGVAEALGSVLGDPRLLSTAHRRASDENYQTNIVHVAADGSFSIVALVWLPAQATPIHSHRSWCVVGVHEGRELETTYRLGHPAGGSLLEPAGAGEMTAGEVTSIAGTTAIHRVENSGPSTAVSLHVYGLDYRLGSSILHVFTPPSISTLA